MTALLLALGAALLPPAAEAWLAGVRAWLQAQPVWLSVAILVGLSVVGAWVVMRTTRAVATHAVGRTRTELDDVLYAELRGPVYVTVALAGVYLAGAWLTLAETQGFVVRAATLSVLVLVWARALVRLGNAVIEVLDEDSSVMDFAPIFENLWTFFVLVGALFVLLSLWQVDVTPLLASAGIAGIAVGFAARDTVANFFGSIALYFDDTYKVGDYVVLDSGEAGTVIDISIRSTRLITRDNVVITVPNSVLNSARITNQSAPRPHKRIRVPVGVTYGSDLDEVEGILLEVAAAEDLVAENPSPRVRFRRFGDSALEYELLAWVANPMLDSKTVHRLNRAIYEGFGEAGVGIPFPQREVTVRSESREGPLDVVGEEAGT